MTKKSVINWLVIIVVLITGYTIGCLLKPNIYNPYVAKLNSNEAKLLADDQKIFYGDIDNDGDSEEFIYYHSSENKQPIINQYSANGKLEYIWSLEGYVMQDFDFLFGNYDNKGNNELYLFSTSKDGLFLYGIDGKGNNNFCIEKLQILEFSGLNIEQNLIIQSAGLHDLNNDGYKELIFTVNNRYSQNHRKVVVYDIYNDKLLKSKEIGLQLVGKPIVVDIDDDGKKEIFLSTLNTINYVTTTDENPSLSSQTIVLNHLLENKFEPTHFKKRMSVSSAIPIKTKDFQGIISLNWTLAKNSKCKLYLLNTKGDIIKQLRLPDKSFVFDYTRNNYQELILVTNTGAIKHYNSNLTQTNFINLNSELNQVKFIDIEQDNEQEVVLVKENSITIYRKDYSSFVEIHIPGIGAQKLHFSVKDNFRGYNQLSVQNDNYQYLISYYPRPNYWTRYLFYMLTSVSLLALYLLLRFLLKKHIEGIRKIERESTYMHIDLVKNQLDPHFVFNALNSIAFSINKDDRKTAYKNLGVFSKFMREAIVSIDDFGRSLEDELNFIKYYLVLEKFRFKEKFNYDIMVSPEVSKSVKIPKMCIFSYVETALKKSILTKEEGGTIDINIDNLDQQFLIIEILDDGIHRKASNEQNITRSMIVMDRSIKFYNKFNSSPIKVTYTELGTTEDPKGTRVVLKIPLDFNYIQNTPS